MATRSISPTKLGAGIRPAPARHVTLTTVSRNDPLARRTRDMARKNRVERNTDNKKKDEELDAVMQVSPYTESFNIYLKGLAKRNKEGIIKVVERMRRERIPMDQLTFNLMLEKVCDLKDPLSFLIYDELKEEAQREDSAVRPSLLTFQLLMRACERNGEYRRAFQLFGEMKELFAIYPDVTLYNTLISFCAPLHDESTASLIVEEMKDRCVEPDVHTYNCLMGVFADAPYELLIQTFEDMLRRKIKPNRRTFNALMKGCQKTCDYDKAFQFFEEMKREGLTPDVVTYNILMVMCKERLEFVVGKKQQGGVRRSKEQLDSAMRAISDLALSLLAEMDEMSVKANTFTYNTLLSVLGSCGDVQVYDAFQQMKDDARAYEASHSGVDGVNVDPSIPSWVHQSTVLDCDRLAMLSTLTDDDCHGGAIGARGVFPGLESYYIVIDASEKMRLPDKAYVLFEELKEVGITPDKATYIRMMDVCVVNSEQRRACLLFDDARAKGVVADTDLFNALMNVFAECGDKELFDIFDDLRYDRHGLSAKPNQDSYNILVKGCCKLEDSARAIQIYEELCDPASPVKPDTVTYNLLMDVCSLKRDVLLASDLILDMKRREVPATITTYCRFMNVFVAAKDRGIVEVFEDIRRHGPQPNLEAYTILLGFHAAENDDAIVTTFETMRKAGVEPDLNAFNIMLNYCASIRDKKKSLKYYEESKVLGLTADITTYNALIAVFAEDGSEVIYKILQEMQDSDVPPNHATFAILGKHKKGMECLRKASDRHLLMNRS